MDGERGTQTFPVQVNVLHFFKAGGPGHAVDRLVDIRSAKQPTKSSSSK